MRLNWQINWIVDWIQGGQGFPCLFHLLTGFYCPGCGGTRAIRLLLRGQFLKSMQYHPFVPYAAVAAAAELVIFAGIMCGFGETGYSDGAGGFGKAECPGEGSHDGGPVRSRRGVRWSRYLDGMQRRYRWWVTVGVGIVLVNWIVKNICLLMGLDLLPVL